MTDISVFITDRFGNREVSLPEATVDELTWALVDVGSFAISISPLAEGATEILLVEREIQVWFDDKIVHWGVPWGCSGGPAGLTFQCEGIMSLLKKRFVDRMSLDYLSVDQAAIAWSLITYAQNESVQANRDLNISAAAFGPTGVPRSPRYNREEHANIWDLLTEFPKMNNGFEFSLVLDPAGKQRFWTPHFPRKGSFKPEFAMRYDQTKQRNISTFTYKEDGLQLLTHGYMTGGSEGDVKFEENYEDVAASERFGVMQGVMSDGAQKDVNWLHDKAVREVNARKEPLIQPEVTSVTTEDLKLGDVVEGDWIPVRIDYGRIQADANYRVKTVTWTPGDVLAFGFDGEAVAA